MAPLSKDSLEELAYDDDGALPFATTFKHIAESLAVNLFDCALALASRDT